MKNNSETGIVRREMGADAQALASLSEPPRFYSYGAEAEDSEEPPWGVRDYLGMIRDRLWYIVAITLVVTALAVFYVMRQPNIYEGEANIQIDQENNPAASSKNTSVIISGPGESSAYFNTQLLLLKSPAFLRRVVKTLGVEQDPTFFARTAQSRPSWSNLLGGKSVQQESDSKPLRAVSIAPASPDGDLTQAQKLAPFVNALRGGLDVKLAESTRLISINFRTTDPTVAARVANVVADTFVQAHWERRAASNSTASDFLQKRIAELQFKIGENEKRLIDYAREHQMLPPDSGQNLETDRLVALDRALIEAENARKLAEAEYQAALAPGAAAAMVEGSGNSQLTSINTRLGDLRQRREVMLLETGENWPEVKELNKQIANLEQQLKDTRERAVSVVLTNLETRYRQALAREQSLRKGFAQQHSQAMATDAAGTNYRLIQQETATYRGLLESLLQRSKENDVILAATPNNVSVTDYATLPVRLVGPRRLSLVAMAFAAALVLSIAFAIFLGSMEDSVPVDSIERVERLLGISTLAVLPSSGGRRLLPGLSRQRRSRDKHQGLLFDEDTRSPLTESYKKLRTSLLLPDAGRAAATLLVTSSLPAEGKTTAVLNTGLVLSQTGGRVLLIDADLRHPSLHEILNIENNQGLSSILSNGHSDAEAIAMIEPNEKGFYVLPAGPIVDNASELLASDRMRSLLRALRSEFDHVIIDSPPITYFTDAVIVSAMVDGVLLVVRGPKTPGKAARHSLQSLEAVGAPILGLILNDVNIRLNDYRYYHRYYSQNDYDNGQSSQKPRGPSRPPLTSLNL
jgi:capsular exopolysaccharide synthesis family protein